MEPDDTARQRRANLLARLLPLARQLIETGDSTETLSGPLRSQIRSLLTGLGGDHSVTTVLGALASAVVVLDENLERGVLATDLPPEQLVEQLIRLAFNRWRSERRKEDKMRHATSQGHGRATDDGPTLLESAVPARNLSSDREEIFAHFGDLVGKLEELLTPRDVLMLKLFAEGYSREEIAQRCDCHRSTVSRKLELFGTLVEQYRQD